MSKPPSWNEIRVNAARFSTRWAAETDENASAQTFWNEFLAIFGVDRKRVASFEARGKRSSTGGRGRIDLLWPGTLVAEHKSAGKDLGSAETQALDYLEALDHQSFPGVILCSDFAHIRIRDLGGDNVPFTFPIQDLVQEIDRFGFIAGYAKRIFSITQEREANIEAAQLMARLYAQLSKNGYSGHYASMLMTRLLFLLFGDDTGMWEKGLFSELLDTRTVEDGTDLGPQLSMLFQVLNQADERRSPITDSLMTRFPYVNGGIFGEVIEIPSFDKEMRSELVRCAAFDWGAISPAIFGSMFQAVKTKIDRRVLGEHYTSEENILKVIRPLFLDGLRRDLEAAKGGPIKLRRLRERLGKLRFLDPACGCGNFLVIAYRELRALELDILKHLREIDPSQNQLSLDATLGMQVSLSQFYGMELEEWPARIAETAMFLVDHQANLALAEEFGQAPDRLPIEVSANIFLDNALRRDWSDILPPSDDVVLLGNPPFVGTRMQTPQQKLDQQGVWAGARGAGSIDFVANWFVKSARYLQGTAGRAGYVATNSITQGEQPATLWRELSQYGMRINYAHRPFAWSNEAAGEAGVHVVIIGFGESPGRTGGLPFYTYPDQRGQPMVIQAKNINAYLVDAPDVLVDSRRKPFLTWVPAMLSGNVPRDGGHLSKITREDAEGIRRVDPVAAKFLRRAYGSEEHIQGRERWCLWLVNATPQELRSSPVLMQRLEAVRKERTGKAGSKGKAAVYPHLFADIYQPATTYLLVPSVCSERREYVPVGWRQPEDILTNAVFAIPGADRVTFGILASKAFTNWVSIVSSRLESRFQLSSGMVYNTFPWPDLTEAGRGRISVLAEAVLRARAQYPSATLADLYDPLAMPKPLRDAHIKLDAGVLSLYGLKSDASEATVMAGLFSRYTDLLGKGSAIHLV